MELKSGTNKQRQKWQSRCHSLDNVFCNSLFLNIVEKRMEISNIVLIKMVSQIKLNE